MQQLASAMDPLLSSPSVTKADALVCGTSSSHRGDFEPPFYSQAPTTRRSDDFVRHIDETATATARSMLVDDRRCTASESVASAHKLTTGSGRPTPSSHTSSLSDNKNWKRRPAPAVVPKKPNSTDCTHSDFPVFDKHESLRRRSQWFARASDAVRAARRSARPHRSIGVGALARSVRRLGCRRPRSFARPFQGLCGAE
jgi:hypothetical protein